MAKGGPQEQPMPYPTCRHVKEDGHLCQAPAMRGQYYCYFHQSHRTRYMKMAQARARGENPPLYIPPLKDMAAVQISITQLCQAIADGAIDLKQARTLTNVLRVASDSLIKAKRESASAQRQRPAADARSKSLPSTNLPVSRLQ
jgi:hypothetical protein